MNHIDIAYQAVRMYAEAHPRPSHVTQKQACEMLNLSAPTVRAMIRRGAIRLNEFGLIPVSEIGRALNARASR